MDAIQALKQLKNRQQLVYYRQVQKQKEFLESENTTATLLSFNQVKKLGGQIIETTSITNGALKIGDSVALKNNQFIDGRAIVDARPQKQQQPRSQLDFNVAYIYQTEHQGTIDIVCPDPNPSNPLDMPVPPHRPSAGPYGDLPDRKLKLYAAAAVLINDGSNFVWIFVSGVYFDIGFYEWRPRNSVHGIYDFGCWTENSPHPSSNGIVLNPPFSGSHLIALPAGTPPGWNGNAFGTAIEIIGYYTDPAGWYIYEVDYVGLISNVRQGILQIPSLANSDAGQLLVFYALGHEDLPPPSPILRRKGGGTPIDCNALNTILPWSLIYKGNPNTDNTPGADSTPNNGNPNDPRYPAKSKYKIWLAGLTASPILLIEFAKNQSFNDRPEIFLPTKDLAVVVLKYGVAAFDGDSNPNTKTGSCRIRIIVIKSGQIVDTQEFQWHQIEAIENVLNQLNPQSSKYFNAIAASHYDIANDTEKLANLVSEGKTKSYLIGDSKNFWLHRFFRNLKANKQGQDALAFINPYNDEAGIAGFPVNTVFDFILDSPTLKQLKNKSILLFVDYYVVNNNTLKKQSLLTRQKLIPGGFAANESDNKFKLLTITAGFYEF